MITADRLRETVSYDPATGVMVWLRPTGRRVKSGDVIGTVSWCRNRYGRQYVGCPTVRIEGKCYYVSRLAWLYVTGSWPENEIDHIDRDRTNNKFDNLRPATRQQNNTNKGAQSNNKLGLKGVSKARGKRHGFEARCNRKYLGYFRTPEEAHAAYCAAATATFGQYGGVS